MGICMPKEEAREPKRRSPFLTAWLTLAIIGHLAAFPLVSEIGALDRAAVETTSWVYICLLTAVISLFAVFNWKRWGFFLFAGATGLGSAILVFHGTTILALGSAATTVLILYAVLQIGPGKTGWELLK